MLAWLKKLGTRTRPDAEQQAAGGRSVTSVRPDGNPGTDPQALLAAAQACHGEGKAERAAALFKQVLAWQPQHFDALTGLGKLSLEAGDNETALLLMARALQSCPDSAGALNNLGVACAACAQHEDALAAFQGAVARAPGTAQYLRNAVLSAAALRRTDLLGRLLASWRQALPSDARETAESHLFAGIHQLQLGHLAEAEAALRQAYALRGEAKGDYEIYLRLGYVLLLRGQRDEALSIWEAAARTFPHEVTALQNLATVALEFGERERARQLLERVLAIKPEAHDARLGLSFIHLARGDYRLGWALYEARTHTPFLAPDLQRFDAECRWHGEPLAGKSLVVWGEQGLGDQLQFVRFLPRLAAYQPDEVSVLCHPSLIPLFATVDPSTRYLSNLEPVPPYDYFVPLLSLPKILDITLADLPAQPYLIAEATRARRWATRFAAGGERRVGLVWGGNPRRHDADLERTDSRRSMALAHFAPLWEVPGLAFYSLQKGEPAEQLRAWPQAARPLIDWTAELDDFADTAALIMNLDLVISVDTSVVHLAGALGKPVWMLSRLDGCWRWLEEGSDSPWYPSARIFRQERYGDWSSVVAALRDALSAWRQHHGGRTQEESL